jgi:hypothetical protein
MSTSTDLPLLIFFKQAAEILGASEGQVRRLVRASALLPYTPESVS